MATNVTSLLREGSSSASRWVQMCSFPLQHPSSLLATNPPVCTPARRGGPHPSCSFRAYPDKTRPEIRDCGALSLKSQRQSVLLTADRREQA